MPRLSVLFVSRTRRRAALFAAAVVGVALLHWGALATFGPPWFDPEISPAPPDAMHVRSVSLLAPAQPLSAVGAVRDAQPLAGPAPRAAPMPAPRTPAASEPATRARPSVDSLVVAPASAPASAPSGTTDKAPPLVERPDGSESAAAAPELPVYRTRLPAAGQWRYRLQRGLAVGEAELSWQPEPTGGYEMRLEGRIAGISVMDWVSRGTIDDAGIAPERHVIRRRGRDHQAANFQRDAHKITFSGPTYELPLPPGVQDRLTWMLQLPAIVEAAPERFAAGAHIVLMVVGARGGSDLWTFTVMGRDAVGGTPALKLVREARRARDEQVEIWLDPARGHIPLRAVLATAEGGAPLEWRLEP